MTARLATLHGERKSGDCEASPGGKCDQLVRAAALRRAKATMATRTFATPSRARAARGARACRLRLVRRRRACLEGRHIAALRTQVRGELYTGSTRIPAARAARPSLGGRAGPPPRSLCPT